MLIRRLRAALVVTVPWAVLWAAYGMAKWLWYFPLPGYPSFEGPWSTNFDYLARLVASGMLYGVASGLTFAALLRLLERGGTAARLTGRRMATWGAFAGILWMPVLYYSAFVATFAGAELSFNLPGTVLRNAVLGTVSALLSWRLVRSGASTVDERVDAPRTEAQPPTAGLSAGGLVAPVAVGAGPDAGGAKAASRRPAI